MNASAQNICRRACLLLPTGAEKAAPGNAGPVKERSAFISHSLISSHLIWTERTGSAVHFSSVQMRRDEMSDLNMPLDDLWLMILTFDHDLDSISKVELSSQVSWSYVISFNNYCSDAEPHTYCTASITITEPQNWSLINLKVFALRCLQ